MVVWNSQINFFHHRIGRDILCKSLFLFVNIYADRQFFFLFNALTMHIYMNE